MYGININSDWKFKDILQNIEAIKTQVHGVIASFSYFESRKKLEFMRYIKQSIYSLKIQEGRKNRILEYIYDDIDFEELKLGSKKKKESQNGRIKETN